MSPAKSAAIPPQLKRILAVIPRDREITLGQILDAAGLSVEETMAALRQLADLGRIGSRQERQADLFVRLYHQLRFDERPAATPSSCE